MASIPPPVPSGETGDSLLTPPTVPSDGATSKASTHEEHSGQLRVAMIGNVDSGKSTLTGCLTRNVADDGRGAARVHVFRHRHETENGRTSSVGVEIMGFNGEAPMDVDIKASRQKHFQNVRAKADRSITFIDLCGHEKYLKTTIFGLTGMLPDYGLVVVGANMGISRMTREHVGIAAALRVPLLVVVTKIDIAPANVLKKTLASVNKLLKAARKMPYLIRTPANIDKAAGSILTDRITPVLLVSAVSGNGMENLRTLLRRLPHRIGAAASAETGALAAADMHSPPGLMDAMPKAEDPSVPHEDVAAAAAPAAAASAAAAAPEFVKTPGGEVALPTGVSARGEAVIDSVFNVPGVGTVVAGTVVRGAIPNGATMLLGPDGNGHFQPVVIRSIHVQYTGSEVALPGGSAAFAIRPKGKALAEKKRKMWVKKGMALVHPDLCPQSSWEFSAEVLILHHQTTLGVGYAPVMHVGVVTQSARILSMSTRDGAPLDTLRTGDRAMMRCRFQYRPEYIVEGNSMLFREGRAKGVGRITAIYKDDELMLPPGSVNEKTPQGQGGAAGTGGAPGSGAAAGANGTNRGRGRSGRGRGRGKGASKWAKQAAAAGASAAAEGGSTTGGTGTAEKSESTTAATQEGPRI